jgi:hypothetical protein
MTSWYVPGGGQVSAPPLVTPNPVKETRTHPAPVGTLGAGLGAGRLIGPGVAGAAGQGVGKGPTGPGLNPIGWGGTQVGGGLGMNPIGWGGSGTPGTLGGLFAGPTGAAQGAVSKLGQILNTPRTVSPVGNYPAPIVTPVRVVSGGGGGTVPVGGSDGGGGASTTSPFTPAGNIAPTDTGTASGGSSSILLLLGAGALAVFMLKKRKGPKLI